MRRLNDVLTDEGGYVLVWAIVSFVVLGALAAASLRSSQVQRRDARAAVEWNASFFVAESGLRAILADADSLTDGLAPGDSTVVAWTTLSGESQYKGVVKRVDNGTGQELYQARVVGAGGGLFGGRAELSLVFGPGPGAQPKPAWSFNTWVVISGNPELPIDCDIFSNDSIYIGGNVTLGGDLYSVYTITIAGSVNPPPGGDPVGIYEYQDPRPVEHFEIEDVCNDATADWWLRNGWAVTSPYDSVEVGSGVASHITWDDGDNTYEIKGDDEVPGFYCVKGNALISGQPGHKFGALDMGVAAEGHIEVPGQPHINSPHPDGVVLLAEGDLKLNGSVELSTTSNVSGWIYGGAQCQISGTPQIGGRLICRGDPDPPGAKNLADESTISGDAIFTWEACAVPGGSAVALPVSPRAWAQGF